LSIAPKQKQAMQLHLPGSTKVLAELPRHGKYSSEPRQVSQLWAIERRFTHVAFASYAFVLPVCSLLRKRRCESRRRGLSCQATRQVPPRPPKEEPTPFPSEPKFPPAAFRLLELSLKDSDLQEMVDALEDFQDLHETDRHWGQFPDHVADCRNIAYNKGQLKILQGILRCIDQDKSEDLRMVALNTLLSLMIGGCTLTRCPPTFVVEAGAVAILCKVANENDDATALEILLELARLAPDTMLPAIIEQGSADACIKVLEQSGADPMDQLTALNLLLSLTKRAPAPIAATGAYEVVKGVSNVALIPRRNKIMNFLRPLVHHEGDSTDSPPLTNIRTVSLKS